MTLYSGVARKVDFYTFRVIDKDKVNVWLKRKRIQRDRRLVAGSEYILQKTVHQYNAQLGALYMEEGRS